LAKKQAAFLELL